MQNLFKNKSKEVKPENKAKDRDKFWNTMKSQVQIESKIWMSLK